MFSCTYFYCQSDSLTFSNTGFIAFVKQKKSKKASTYSVDYLFFREVPKVKRFDTPLSLIKKGGILFNQGYYYSSSLEKYVSTSENTFDKAPFFSKANKYYSIDFYRVSIEGYIKQESGLNYCNYITSHSYSTLCDSLEQKKNRPVIYPIKITPIIK